MRTAAVLTVSDSSARGERADRSGPATAELLRQEGFDVTHQEIVADDQPTIEAALVRLSDEAQLIVLRGAGRSAQLRARALQPRLGGRLGSPARAAQGAGRRARASTRSGLPPPPCPAGGIQHATGARSSRAGRTRGS